MTKPRKIGNAIVIGIVFILVLFAGYDFVKNLFRKPQPEFSAPQTAELKTGHVSKGENPEIPFTLARGFEIHVFAKGLRNPRTLIMSPEGTLLVSDPTNNIVTALPDKDNNGVADENRTIISGENRVHGLSFYNGELFIAGLDKVVKYGWDEARLIATRGPVLFSLPQNNNHNNRSLVFDTIGNMYLSLGSTCDVCNDAPLKGGSVLLSDFNGKTPVVFARGIRNVAFLALNPASNELWGSEMGRDNLGDNIPPDEINIIREDNDYGWPKCYGDKIHDTNFDKSKSDPCASTQSPIYKIPAHSAPLGLVFITSTQFPSEWQGDLLVAYHGSWNRSNAVGYKVVRLQVNGNTITGSEDFLSGFNPGTQKDDSLGRPVDMVYDKKGNLYLSDDKKGEVYIIQKKD